MPAFTIDIRDEEAEALRELARRCSARHHQGALTSHGAIDVHGLLRMLAEDAALVVLRAGSWEASNLAGVLEAHGYSRADNGRHFVNSDDVDAIADEFHDVSRRLRGVLNQEGVNSWADVAGRGRKYWQDARNCGRALLDEIDGELRERGLAWAK